MTQLRETVFKKSALVFLVGMLSISTSVFAADTDKKSPVEKEKIYHVEIIPTGIGSLQQITLTEDIYLNSRDRGLNDLLVLDSLGEKLPFEITTPENKILEHKKDVAIYPIREPRHLLKRTDNISFKYDQENRIREIQKTDDSKKQQKVVGYLLDLGEDHANKNISLTFELSDVEQTSFLRFDIDQSDNLKSWASASSGEVLAQLLDRQKLTVHDQIQLSRIHSRYLRINLLDQLPAFSIKSAAVEYSERQNVPLVWGQQKDIIFSGSEQAYIINTSPSLAYRVLRLDLAEAPSILRGKLYVRNNDKEIWKLKNHLNFFHIIDGEKHIIKDQFSLAGLRAGQIKIKFDYLNDTQKSEPLKLKLAWAPQRLTFVANGNTPYEITVGKSNKNPSSRLVELAQNRKMIAVIKDEITTPIKQAKFGSSRLIVIEPIVESYVNWKKISLWIVLVLGVVVMAWMAKGLLKQVD